MVSNIHDKVGWFHCANLRCRKPLGRDHVTLLTTAHMRRFCSVECIIEGQQAWHELIQRWGGTGDPTDLIEPTDGGVGA